jgi:hypothetical protein
MGAPPHGRDLSTHKGHDKAPPRMNPQWRCKRWALFRCPLCFYAHSPPIPGGTRPLTPKFGGSDQSRAHRTGGTCPQNWSWGIYGSAETRPLQILFTTFAILSRAMPKIFHICLSTSSVMRLATRFWICFPQLQRRESGDCGRRRARHRGPWSQAQAER